MVTLELIDRIAKHYRVIAASVRALPISGDHAEQVRGILADTIDQASADMTAIRQLHEHDLNQINNAAAKVIGVVESTLTERLDGLDQRLKQAEQILLYLQERKTGKTDGNR